MAKLINMKMSYCFIVEVQMIGDILSNCFEVHQEIIWLIISNLFCLDSLIIKSGFIINFRFFIIQPIKVWIKIKDKNAATENRTRA